MSGATTYGAPLLSVSTQLVATNPSLLLTAQTNIFSSAPINTSAILPAINSGTIYVSNFDQVNSLPVYPPANAQINLLGYNEPYILAPNSAAGFATNNSGELWNTLFISGAPVTAAEITAAFKLLPSFTEGDPGVANWWLNAAGNPQQGIVANISQISNPNLVLTLLASGAMG